MTDILCGLIFFYFRENFIGMEYADCNWNGAMTSVSAPFFVPIFMGTKIGNDTEIWKGVDIRNCLVETKKYTKKVRQ